jgi:hypothetical protein
MRRSIPAAVVGLVGLVLLVDFVLINPLLADVSDALLELIVLLAAAAAIAGAIALVLRHWTDLVERRGDWIGSLALLVSFGVIVLAGFYPGSEGAADPAVRWVVAALLGPLVASLFALVFVFLLVAMRRGMTVRRRETTVMLLAAGVVIVLLLPLGGLLGERLASAAGWILQVPLGGVFRGLLIGTGIVMAVHATRVLLAMDGSDD